MNRKLHRPESKIAQYGPRSPGDVAADHNDVNVIDLAEHGLHGGRISVNVVERSYSHAADQQVVNVKGVSDAARLQTATTPKGSRDRGRTG